MDLSAVILAGGESRRMGTDKAWLRVSGQPLLMRAIQTARHLGAGELFISGRPGVDYSSLNCPVLLDPQPGLGPLAGIESALGAAAAPLLLVLAVDLPRMTTAFLRRLLERCRPDMGVVPVLHGRLEPLAAIYPKRSHAVARQLLAEARYAARDFAAACHLQALVQAWAVSPEAEGCLTNWNEPSDIT
jgi:molybdopterin-guanine dinucleotide biosynthesis protein A